MKTALVIGRAAGVWDEVAAAKAMVQFDEVFVINASGVDYPGEMIWVSFHAELFKFWADQRKANGHPDAKAYWASTYKGSPAGYRVKWPPVVERVACEGGSSGLVTVMAAVECGYERIVLAGVPMQPEREHYDQPGPWNEALLHRKAWLRQLARYQGTVRSMSGWTMELLGYPTPSWLQGDEQ